MVKQHNVKIVHCEILLNLQMCRMSEVVHWQTDREDEKGFMVKVCFCCSD